MWDSQYIQLFGFYPIGNSQQSHINCRARAYTQYIAILYLCGNLLRYFLFAAGLIISETIQAFLIKLSIVLSFENQEIRVKRQEKYQL
jgi:hypothetical protein